MKKHERQVWFHEEQRLTQWWLWAVLGLVAGLAWWAFIQQIVLGQPFGDSPAPDGVVGAVWVAVGLVLPWLLRAARLEVEVDQECVRVQYVPFMKRRVGLDTIRTHEAISYRPLRQWGGWGIRWVPGRGWAYSARGDQGVRLTLLDGRIVLVGSQRAQDLEHAISQALAERATR